MNPKKEIAFTMDEIKELNFQLSKALERLQQKIEKIQVEDERLIYTEKRRFVQEILEKINH